MNLLLLSNSRMPDGGYLAHALDAIREVLAGRRRLLFIPFAGVTLDWDDYTRNVREALAGLDVEIESVHQARNPIEAVASADAIVVGGGNTFQLLKYCRQDGLLQLMAARVRAEAAYIGWSAGANLACPTICTTNDMPIVDPEGFDALGLIDFQINPHYTNALPFGHQGETRNQRLAELLRANPAMRVLGLPEGDWLRVSGSEVRLHGPHPAMLFRANREPGLLQAQAAVDFCEEAMK